MEQQQNQTQGGAALPRPQPAEGAAGSRVHLGHHPRFFPYFLGNWPKMNQSRDRSDQSLPAKAAGQQNKALNRPGRRQGMPEAGDAFIGGN